MKFMEQCAFEGVIARLAAERDRLKAENEDLKNALDAILAENAALSSLAERLNEENIKLWCKAHLISH